MSRTRASRPPRARWWVAAAAAALAGGSLTLLPGPGSGQASADPTEEGEAGTQAASYPAAATGTAVPWTGLLNDQAPCPEGMTRSSLLYGQSFEGGIPQSSFNDGWYTFGGLEGTRSARAAVSSADPRDSFFLPYVDGSVGARTMLALATKGTQTDSGYTRAQVNSVDLRVGAGTGWEGRVYDVTAATDDEGGWLGTWFEHRSKGGAETRWDLDSIQLYTCRDAPVSRISGDGRYATAAQVAATYPAGLDVVYLATGQNFADAVSASALAARQDAPILLTRQDVLPAATRDQLQRLRPARLVVLGGGSAISTEVEQEASAFARATTRVTGADRYAVSAALAQSYDPGVPVVYVASGTQFPDALSVGALAGHTRTPLLITPPGGLPVSVEEQIARLNPGRIVVVGGASAVSDAVLEQLRAHTAGSVTRLTGQDRYAVSAAVAAQFPSGGGRVYLASGQTFPDALVGAARAGSQGVPVLLSRDTALPGTTRTALDALDARRGVLLGGRAALNAVVMDQTGARVG